MIESRYWRTELRDDIAWLKSRRTYRRWSEKQQVLYERKLILTAFQVRSLLERLKVNDRARGTGMPVVRYKKISDQPFTLTGTGWPHERFDMETPEFSVLSAIDVCNQLIHYYWMQTCTECGGFISLLVFSDYTRHKWAYEFRIDDLVQLFQVFASDSSAVVGMESEWSEKKQDYVVKKSWGPGDRQATTSIQWTPDGSAELKR